MLHFAFLHRNRSKFLYFCKELEISESNHRFSFNIFLTHKEVKNIKIKSMKTVFSTFIILTIGIQSFAQITITSADMPNTGDTIRFSTTTMDSLTEATYTITGNNMTWDFFT